MNGTDWTVLRQVIGHAEQADGVIGVAVIAPSGERVSHNGNRRFVAASTVKVPIMIELFRRIDAGQCLLTDSYRLRDADRAAGSGVMRELHEGMALTVGDLVYLMISISDNTATNILIDRVGMDQVTATMRRLGMANSTLARKMRGRERLAGEEENWATPDDYATAIAAMPSNRAASAGACARMIALLEKQQNDRRYRVHHDGSRAVGDQCVLRGVCRRLFCRADHRKRQPGCAGSRDVISAGTMRRTAAENAERS